MAYFTVSTMAANGTMFAVMSRDAGAEGQHVDVSMQQAVAAGVMAVLEPDDARARVGLRILERSMLDGPKLDAARNNLPIQLTDFIGRPEVEELKRLVRAARLVTVLAPGGEGKTRSAIQASAELISEFPDGVFWCQMPPGSIIFEPGDEASTPPEEDTPPLIDPGVPGGWVL